MTGVNLSDAIQYMLVRENRECGWDLTSLVLSMIESHPFLKNRTVRFDLDSKCAIHCVLTFKKKVTFSRGLPGDLPETLELSQRHKMSDSHYSLVSRRSTSASDEGEQNGIR